MARSERWLLLWTLTGCNAIFGIHRHEYRAEMPTETAGDGGAAGAADSSAAPDSHGTFTALWDFESMRDGQVPSSTQPPEPLTVQQGTLAAGPSGSHLVLSGSGSAVAPGPIIDASASFSISVWVRFDRFDTWNTIVSQDGDAISSFFLQKRDSQYLGLTTYASDDPGAPPCVTTGSLQPRQGEWYHVVATRDASTNEQRLYVDGVLSGRATCPGGFRTSGPLVVGRGKWNTPTDFTAAAIDDLGVADRALSPGEVVELYHLGRPDAHHYLFAYFREIEQGRGDGLHFAHSHDALAWNAAGAGRLFLSPTVGGRSFRDPHLMRDPAGTYHLVWTSSCVPWADPNCVQDRGFAHATSQDLVTFSDQTFIEVPREKLDVEHFWAPETFYDSESAQYLLTWASPPDLTPNADPHSIYYLLTKDFVSFSEPAVFYARPGRDLIDATIMKQENSYFMFLKDEGEGQKNLRVVTSPSLLGEGAFSADPSAPLTGVDPAEGPAPLVQDGKLLLFFDKYATGALGALRSRDLSDPSDVAKWEDISGSISASGLRHGTPLEVPYEVFRAVALRAAQ